MNKSHLKILFEDNHLLIIDKPAGLLTQPTSHEENSLETIAKEWLKNKYNKQGAVYLHAVHRLDKPVSGIVLFAKTSKALSRLNEAMRQKKIKKEYLALVEGIVSPLEGVKIDFMVHDDHRAKIVSKNHPGAKQASLSYRVLSCEKNRTLLSIVLETGKYHQIRLQLSHSGHPLVGDKKYGGGSYDKETEKIALRHYKLTFEHPVTKQQLEIEAGAGGIYNGV